MTKRSLLAYSVQEPGGSTKDLLRSRDRYASVVRLNESLRDFAIFDQQSVTLASVVTKYLLTIKCKVQLFSELARWIA